MPNCRPFRRHLPTALGAAMLLLVVGLPAKAQMPDSMG